MLAKKSHKELLQLSRNLIQPLVSSFHKGQAGKIAVIGGCEDYTGAPFFLAHLAALTGADLSHVICETQAASVIKLYSPDLMVHPYLHDLGSAFLQQNIDSSEWKKLQSLTVEEVLNKKHPALDTAIENLVMPKIVALLGRIDVVVIGPGFGRDPFMVKLLVRLLEEIRVHNKPVILDADALYVVSLRPLLVQNFANAILTPNVVEFGRLAKALDIKVPETTAAEHEWVAATRELSQKLSGATVIRKGSVEVIAKNDEFLVNSTRGSNRRVGGQGDTLTGAVATLVAWSRNYHQGLWEVEKPHLNHDELTVLACFAACSLVRAASEKAFERYGRSMQTSNVHEFLGEAYDEYYDSDKFIKL